MVGLAACVACADLATKYDDHPAPQSFYTVMGEIALARHEPLRAAELLGARARIYADSGRFTGAASIPALAAN